MACRRTSRRFTLPARARPRQRSGMVRMVGLEPTRLTPLPPQDSVSTNSTTSARIGLVHCSGVLPSSSSAFGCVPLASGLSAGACSDSPALSGAADSGAGVGAVAAGGAGNDAGLPLAGCSCTGTSRMLVGAVVREPRNASDRLVTKKSVASTARRAREEVTPTRARRTRCPRRPPRTPCRFRRPCPLDEDQPDEADRQQDVKDHDQSSQHSRNLVGRHAPRSSKRAA